MAMYQLEPIFGALSDPTRFAVVERLCRGPASVSELQGPFKMAGPTFLRHLRVLEDAGLVESRKTGRVRTVALKREALTYVERWVQQRRREVEAQLDRMEAILNGKTENRS